MIFSSSAPPGGIISLETFLATAAGVATVLSLLWVVIFGNRSARDLRSAGKDRGERTRHTTPFTSNLPMAIPFVNRDHEAASIIDRIVNGDLPGVLLKGPPGIGKSALAIHVAHRIAHTCETSPRTRPFDGIFQISAKADRVTIASFADTLGRFLGFPSVTAESSTVEKVDAVYRILSSMRLLVIVDNLETISDRGFLDSLFGLPRTCRLLLTSRTATTADRPLQVFDLRPLSRVDSLTLLRNEFDRLRLPPVPAAENDDLDRMLVLSGGSPLGIKWAAGRMGQGASVVSVVDRLETASADLFQSTFADSWTALDEPARRALMALATLGTSCDRSVIADALLGGAEAEDAISALVDVSLFEVQRIDDPLAAVRYSLHPLARAYARKRLADHPGRDEVQVRVARAVLRFVSARSNYQRGRAEYEYIEWELPNAIQIIEGLAEASVHDSSGTKLDLLVAISDGIAVYLWSRGYWTERVAICRRVFEVASDHGRPIAAGRQAALISQVLVWRDDVEEAEKWSQRATSLMSAGGPLDRATADRIAALLLHRKGDTAAAVARMAGVLEAIRAGDTESSEIRETIRSFADWACAGPNGYRAGELAVAQEIGIMHVDSGDRDQAVHWLDISLDLANMIHDAEAKAISLSHKGRSYGLADAAAARPCFEEGLALARQVGRRSTEARCLLGLAELELHDRHAERAEELAEEAGGIFTRLGMRPEEASSRSLASRARGRMDRRYTRIPFVRPRSSEEG